MKKPVPPLLFFTLFLININAQTFCLQFVEISNDGTNHIVEIQAMGSADFKLGSSNLQFGYNTAAINTPVYESSLLAPPFYQIPTVTTPASGQTSFNIELAFAGFGTTISSSSWTPLGQISFSIVDAAQSTNYTWSYIGGTTQTVVFLDDEATQIFAATPINTCLVALNVALPLELLDFEVRPIKNKVIELNWTSLNEVDFLGFGVERSMDGKEFTAITFVNSKGNPMSEESYTLVDADVRANQTYYYRLKMLDMDGSFAYSEMLHAKLNDLDEFNLYPNPTQGKITIAWNEVLEGVTQISLTNVAQQVLNVYDISEINPGNKFEIDLSDYPKGIYWLRINLDNSIQLKRIVLQ